MRINTNAWNRIRYGLYAPVYDLVARRLDRGRRRSIALLDLKPGAAVLLVGAGTGLDLPHLPPGLAVTAVDLSPAMLHQAEARAGRLGRAATFRVMDAHHLDLPDAAFDAILLHLILAVVPDPEACIREAARVLRPGGRIGIFDKFLPEGARPSLLRRAAGAVTNALFSDINRTLGPLLRHAGLRAVHEEPSLFGGMFKVVVAEKAA
jgi:phosphatidylethanolamine/phosphatidyl-N-methylethanolamine N-methyltransferase